MKNCHVLETKHWVIYYHNYVNKCSIIDENDIVDFWHHTHLASNYIIHIKLAFNQENGTFHKSYCNKKR